MSCLAWNCRGLGNPQTVHELSIMVRKKDPIVLFLSETKLDEKQLEVLRCQWRFTGKFVVPSRGQSGGLVMYWSGCVGVSISSYPRHHIDAVLDYRVRMLGDLRDSMDPPRWRERQRLGVFYVLPKYQPKRGGDLG